MPEHEAVVAAVTDPELARWVADRKAYTVAPTELPRLGRVWRVTAIELSHPMAFYLVDLGEGRLAVTSGQIEGIAALVRRDPTLFDGTEGAELLVTLAAPVAGAARLITDEQALASADLAAQAAFEPPRIAREAQGWLAELFVVDDLDRLRKWRMVVPDKGAASWEQTTIARDVGVFQ